MSSPSSESIVVVGISGSLRQHSYTHEAVRKALQGAEEIGAKTKFIDLNQYELVFCDGRSDNTSYPPDVHRLRQEVKEAQGLILGTPEYHGSMSGVLKNALDLLSFEEMEGKMIGLIGVSAGRQGGLHALNSLRHIGRSLHAWVIPEQASIPQAYEAFDEAGNFLDEALGKRVHNVGRQVTRFAYLHTSQKSREFLKLWEEATWEDTDTRRGHE